MDFGVEHQAKINQKTCYLFASIFDRFWVASGPHLGPKLGGSGGHVGPKIPLKIGDTDWRFPFFDNLGSNFGGLEDILALSERSGGDLDPILAPT